MSCNGRRPRRREDHLDLFITGHDGRVYTRWWTQAGGWSGYGDDWMSLGGAFPRGAPVAAVARRPTNLDLFSTGNDERVYTRWWQEAGGWSGPNWMSLGGFFPAWT